MTERADDCEPVAHEGRVRREDEIGYAAAGFHAFDGDVARALDGFDEAIPLPDGIGRGEADVARHPRIDVVRDREVGGRTHQESRHGRSLRLTIGRGIGRR